MHRAANVAIAVVLVAIAGVVGGGVWLLRERRADSAAASLPVADTVRTVEVDPADVAGLPVAVEVPAGEGECPPHAFRAPGEPLAAVDGGRTFLLGDDGSAILTVCLGSVAELGTPEELVADIWAGTFPVEDAVAAEMMAELESATERLYVERVASPYGEAIALTTRIGPSLVTDHYVERDGWVHAVGYLRRDGSGDPDRALVDAVLASWQWR